MELLTSCEYRRCSDLKHAVLYPVKHFVYNVLTQKFVALIRDEETRYKVNVPKKLFTDVLHSKVHVSF